MYTPLLTFQIGVNKIQPLKKVPLFIMENLYIFFVLFALNRIQFWDNNIFYIQGGGLPP